MRVISLSLAIILLLGVLSCEPGAEEGPYATPESTILELSEAMKAEDYERAIKCYSQDALVSTGENTTLTSKEMKELFILSLKESQKPFANATITIKDVQMTAKVKFMVGKEEREVHMIKEAEGWKIATNL